MISREYYLAELKKAFQVHPIVGILGPRQSGKTTLARQYLAIEEAIPASNYFDLEDMTDLARLADPKMALESLSGLIVIDEVQRVPELFPTLRVLVDANKSTQRYLILGSVSTALIKQSSESLAGRIEYLALPPLNLSEVHNMHQLWARGGYPKSYLAVDEEASFRWRKAYIRTFLERDIPNLGIHIAPGHLQRFWMMLAHYHGNILNISELAKSMSISSKTVVHYLDILVGTFMIRRLPAWHENLGKRQVKSPKIYFRDSGLYHALLQIEDSSALQLNPKLGGSWEGFALEEIIRRYHIAEDEVYFWSTQNQAELDLLFFYQGQKWGFEFKYTSTPKITKSMQIALEDLNLDRLTLVYPGKKSYPLGDKIQVLGLGEI